MQSFCSVSWRVWVTDCESIRMDLPAPPVTLTSPPSTGLIPDRQVFGDRLNQSIARLRREMVSRSSHQMCSNYSRRYVLFAGQLTSDGCHTLRSTKFSETIDQSSSWGDEWRFWYHSYSQWESRVRSLTSAHIRQWDLNPNNEPDLTIIKTYESWWTFFILFS